MENSDQPAGPSSVSGKHVGFATDPAAGPSEADGDRRVIGSAWTSDTELSADLRMDAEPVASSSQGVSPLENPDASCEVLETETRSQPSGGIASAASAILNSIQTGSSTTWARLRKGGCCRRRRPENDNFQDPFRTLYINHDRHHNLKFRNNSVSTTKYSIYSFFPRYKAWIAPHLFYLLFFCSFFFEQFGKASNFFFLFCACIAMVPQAAIINPGLAITPLLVVLVLSGIKELIEDFRRVRTMPASPRLCLTFDVASIAPTSEQTTLLCRFCAMASFKRRRGVTLWLAIFYSSTRTTPFAPMSFWCVVISWPAWLTRFGMLFY